MAKTINDRHDPEGRLEGDFRRDVRDALGMDLFTRDASIIEEIKRLKRVEAEWSTAKGA
jgi:hypothetical protein